MTDSGNLRVLQLCNKPPYPPVDGGCKAMHNLGKGLLEMGVHLKVISISTHKHPASNEENEYYRRTEFEHCFVNTSLNPLEAFINLFGSSSYNIDRFYSAKLEMLIEKALQSGQYDIVQLESPFMGPYLDCIRKNSSAPVVLRAHNIEYELWEQKAKKEQNPLKKRYLALLAKRLKRYEHHLATKTDGIAAIAPGDAVYFKSVINARKVGFIPFGIEPPDVPEQTVETEDLFYIGAFDWGPNLEGMQWFLDEVWPGLYNNFPSLKCHIAGKSMPASFSNDLHPGITAHGEVPSASGFMDRHDMMIVPLFRGSGIRVKIIEAMARGKTVIATTKAARGISCTHQKDILLADDAGSFCQAVAYCLNQPEKKKAIGKEAKKLIEKEYRMDQVSKNLVEFYHTLASG